MKNIFCLNKSRFCDQRGVIPVVVLAGLVLVFAIGGWYFISKWNINSNPAPPKFSLDCTTIGQKAGLPLHEDTESIKAAGYNLCKSESGSGQKQSLEKAFNSIKTGSRYYQKSGDVGIIINTSISRGIGRDEKVYANDNYHGSYKDGIKNIDFLVFYYDKKDDKINDQGTFPISDGEGGFAQVASKTNLDSFDSPSVAYQVFTKAKNGYCLIQLDASSEYAPDLNIQGGNLSSTGSGDALKGGGLPIHPDLTVGKELTKSIAIKLTQDIDKAIGDACSQNGQVAQRPPASPAEDILSKIRNYKVNNAMEGYDSETAAKIAGEISQALLKDSSINSEAISGQISADESLAQTLKKDPNYKDFYKRDLEETEQAAKAGTLGFVVLSAYGEISAKKPGGDWFNLKQQDVLPLGSTIFTSTNSDAFIVTDHGPLSLKVEPFTELVLTIASLNQFSLPSGKIEIKTRDVDVKVEKSSFLTDFKISSPNTTASPTGTGFFFWYNKNLHLSIIGVYEGSVEIKSDGSGEKQTVVGSGKSKPNIMAITDKGIIKL